MKDEGLALVLLAVVAAVAGGGGFAFREYVSDGDRWQASSPRVVEQPAAAPPSVAITSPSSVVADAAERADNAIPPESDSDAGMETPSHDRVEPTPPPLPPPVAVPEPAPDRAPELAKSSSVGTEDERPAEQRLPLAKGPSAPPIAKSPPIVASLPPKTPAPLPGAPETFSDANAPTKRGQTFASARGLLPYPTDGRLVGRFGADAGGGLTSKGITLAASSGSSVVAPYDGHIAYAGSFRGYGRVLIIDHGEGYHSLLAGLEDSDGTVGQWVLAGEPIGAIAANADADPMLYVEFWHDGEPVDPLPWLAPVRPRVASVTDPPVPPASSKDGDDAGTLARLERLAAAAALDAERSRIFRSLPKPGTDDEPSSERALPEIASAARERPDLGTPETTPQADAQAGSEEPKPGPMEHAAVEPESGLPSDQAVSESKDEVGPAPKAVPHPRRESETSLRPTGTESEPAIAGPTPALEGGQKLRTPSAADAAAGDAKPQPPEPAADRETGPEPESPEPSAALESELQRVIPEPAATTEAEPEPETPGPVAALEDDPKTQAPETVSVPETEAKSGTPEPTVRSEGEATPAPADAGPAPSGPAPAPKQAIASAASGYRIQVAAMRSADAAAKEWRRLLVKNKDVPGALEMSVTPVDLGTKGTFYRIRAGYFTDRTTARATCRTLANRKVACLVVGPDQ